VKKIDQSKRCKNDFLAKKPFLPNRHIYLNPSDSSYRHMALQSWPHCAYWTAPGAESLKTTILSTKRHLSQCFVQIRRLCPNMASFPWHLSCRVAHKPKIFEIRHLEHGKAMEIAILITTILWGILKLWF